MLSLSVLFLPVFLQLKKQRRTRKALKSEKKFLNQTEA